MIQERKSTAEMFGELLRDIGVLVIVFFPFDDYITFHTFRWKFDLGSAALAIAAMGLGIAVERRRGR